MTSKPNKTGDDETADSEFNIAFNEVTVVRPRSVLEDAFDAHTVVRPSAQPAADFTSPVDAGEFPPPPPLHKVSQPIMREAKSVETEVTRIAPPPASPTVMPQAPTAAELEAQAIAVAQERARLKAQQAAEQAMQKAAAQADTARRASEEAARETIRRQQAEKRVRESAIEDMSRRESHKPELMMESPSHISMESAPRQFPLKWIAAAIVAVCLVLYFMGVPPSTSGEGQGGVDSASTKELSKTGESPFDARTSVGDGGTRKDDAGSNRDAKSLQTILSAFDDAFSRSQVRARPESQD